MRLRAIGAIALGTLLVLGRATTSHAQSPLPFTGYMQNVPVWSGQTPLARRNLTDVGRLRMATNPSLGPVSIGVAYEQVLTLTRRSTMSGMSGMSEMSGLGVGAVPGGGEWLDLGWTISEGGHAQWQHRLDRLHIDWSPTSALQLSAGRQAVSWGTTLFLTPADPFIPFSPADPFREFRGGVDAVRARIYPGPLSEIDLVVRPTKTVVGEELTALARGLTTWKNWELSGWVGALYGDSAAAFGAAGSVGAWAVRTEGLIRKVDSGTVFRGTIGVDHLSQVNGRDLYLIAEYQRDGLGAANRDQYAGVLASDTYLRGEHQVLGRDETFVQSSYQLHPLWSLGALWISNLNDRSALVSPSFSYSAGNNASITGGIFFGIGTDDFTSNRVLPSEFGLAGKTAFLSLSWFF